MNCYVILDYLRNAVVRVYEALIDAQKYVDTHPGTMITEVGYIPGSKKLECTLEESMTNDYHKRMNLFVEGDKNYKLTITEIS